MQNTLNKLNNYPFQQLRELIADIEQDTSKTIGLHIGTPYTTIPEQARQIIVNSNSWNKYPNVADEKKFAKVVFNYLTKRFSNSNTIKNFNQDCIIPTLGSKEALFNACYYLQFINAEKKKYIIVPNPGYQVYQGACIINGYTPYFYNTKQEEGHEINFLNISEDVLKNTSAIFLCNPSNPQGACFSLNYQQELIKLANKYNITLIVDECYIDVYFKKQPYGILNALANQEGTLNNIIITGTLSKRSGGAGLRSGYLVTSQSNIKTISKIRSYSGSAMTKALLDASIFCWQDEKHVEETRDFYRQNINIANQIFKNYKGYEECQAGFFVWLKVKNALKLTRKLYKDHNILVLPGKYLCNEVNDINPGDNYIRLALVNKSDVVKQSLQTIINVIESNGFAV